MLSEWTGAAVGKMHINRVTQKEVAGELGVSKQYVSMVLSEKKTPPRMEQRINAAIDRILERREKQEVSE